MKHILFHQNDTFIRLYGEITDKHIITISAFKSPIMTIIAYFTTVYIPNIDNTHPNYEKPL